MEWLQSNWIWIALGVGFIAFHMFGHSGHGSGHGSHSKRGQSDPDGTNDALAAPTAEHTHADGPAPRVSGPNDPPLHATPAHAGHDALPSPTDSAALMHRKQVEG